MPQSLSAPSPIAVARAPFKIAPAQVQRYKMQVERFELPLVLSCCAASSNGFWHTRFREDIEDLVKLTVDKMDTGADRVPGRWDSIAVFWGSGREW